MSVGEYAEWDAVDVAALVRRGEVSPVEVWETAMARHHEVDAAIHAVVEWYDDPTPGAHTGPLAGVPFLRKDIGSGEAGRRTEMGSRLAAGTVRPVTDPFLARLIDAGVAIVGRSAVPEFAQHGTTESVAFGTTRNPIDPSVSAGGSSGGAAAAVAAGVVPLAHASDAAGSIRIPAAACGLVGLRPGRGVLGVAAGTSGAGDVSWGGISEEFVVTRSVRDARAALDVLAPSSPPAPPAPPGGLRLGLDTRHWAGFAVEPAVVDAVEAAARALADAGHDVTPVTAPVDHEQVMSAWHPLFSRWVVAEAEAAAVATGRSVDGTTVEPVTLLLVDEVAALTPADLAAAEATRRDVTARLMAGRSEWDVLVTPTLGRSVIPLGWVDGGVESLDTYGERNDEIFPYSFPFNLAGWASLSVPAGRTGAGHPVGVQFSAPPGHERTLLALAEVVTGGAGTGQTR